MTVRNLEHLFRPKSIAVIGASARAQSLGAIVMRNLVASGFAGSIMPVNPKHDAIEGKRCYASVADLPDAPDLGVICTPPRTVPGIIAELGARGTKAAVVLTAGLNAQGDDGRSLTAAMLDAARPHVLRILGPNCVGLLVPGINLNASFAHTSALPGQARHGRAVGRADHGHARLGQDRAASGSRTSFRWATAPTSISATSSTIWAAIPARAPSCSTSNRSPRRASSCRPRAPRAATSRSSP